MTPPPAAPLTLSVPDFSAHMGWKRNYGYQVKKDGRLVMAPDGKNVLVAESAALYEATKDPSKAGVAKRHADKRAAQAAPPAVPPDAPPGDSAGPADDAAEDPADQANYDYQRSKAKREHFAALEAEASYRAKIKDLLEAADVRSVLAETVTVLRTAMESMPYGLCAVLAATQDEAEVKKLLTTEVEAALKAAQDRLERLGRGEF